MLGIGLALMRALPGTDALGGAVAALRGLRAVAVELHQHGVVHVRAERALDRFQVRPVPVRGELHAVGEARRQIVHELLRVARVAAADELATISLLSASIAVHVHVSPAPSGAALAVATFFALA